MPKSPKKTAKKKAARKPIKTVELPERVGLPMKDSIIGITTIGPEGAAAAPGVEPVFQIFHTNEIDEYEEGAESAAAAAAAAKKLPTGDNYQGTDRKAAK